MRRLSIIFTLITGISMLAGAQSHIVQDFTPVCDSLAVLMSDRCGVKGELKLKAVMKRKSFLDFYFNETLSDYPWYKSDPKWFRQELKRLFPEEYSKYKIGDIYSRKVALDKLVMPELGNDGNPSSTPHRRKQANHGVLVNRLSGLKFGKGLQGRHIALWQSHGRYFDQNEERWLWQRPCLFQTCEDMFTQGFVLPYLTPMLENAGAYVLMPRERDIQRNEIIADNDSTAGGRGIARYSENGIWTEAGVGFADIKPVYVETENPFRMGTARQALCAGPRSKPTAHIQWTPEIQERGEYAVYVSYKSLPSSTTAAHYTVTHMGGTSEFAVNQKMGGSTWIYLGTFEFDEGTGGYVTLDNSTPEGYILEVGATVTADAVRFGGGMGNIARCRWIDPEDSVSVVCREPVVSGLPRSAEAARYWLQWAGADTTVYYQNSGKNDYRDDFMSRGDWVASLDIPIDLSFGFHTDAGVTPNDSLVGTLAIYTYRSDGRTTIPSGEDRLTSRMFADIVQSQVISDIRNNFDSLWTRRSIWDRAYRESRTPTSPAMLLELLSHQNFADMKYGLDPSFRFAVSRAVYKGMLKYMSNRYGNDYVVQPLPVTSVGVRFGTSRDKAIISWKSVEDPLEPTASAKGYLLYKKCGDGTFDEGTVIKAEVCGEYLKTETDISPDQVHSFKIAAYNDGGLSFPSEVVSIGYPAKESPDSTTRNILIVNNFDRTSGPAWFESGDRAGFDNSLDSGVPYVRDITYTGEMHEFRRDQEWISNDRPGFGASYSDKAGQIVAGNTFDYPSVHGKAVLAAGHPFFSCSNETFTEDSTFRREAWTIDLICGKQVTTRVGRKDYFTVFTPEIQNCINRFAASGGNILVSGAYIGTDLEDSIYPVDKDSLSRTQAIKFAKDILGYRYITNRASRNGRITSVKGGPCNGIDGELMTEMNSVSYCVESPDGIAPANPGGKTICRYSDSGISAGIAYQGKGYRTVCLGFPVEAMTNDIEIENTIRTILEYFEK